jgi:hypothetical protein
MRFLFPPIRLPVGFGQTRTASQLPVLTMITGYCPLGLGLAGADAPGRGLVCRLVVADPAAGCGAAGAGVRRRGQGLALLVRDTYYVQPANYWINTGAATWGWWQLILGVIVLAAGLESCRGRPGHAGSASSSS